jgi:hypothetical protein
MDFDMSRLRRSDQLMGGGAILLFIFMFLFKWYGVSSNVPSVAGVNLGGNLSFDGWHSFTNSRWIWLITIIVALGAVAVSSGALKFETPVKLSVVVAGLGALSTVLILYRIVHHPTASESIGSFHASVGIKIGIWLGLIAAAITTYGGYLGMQEEGTSISDVRAQASEAMSNLSASAGGGAGAAPAGGSSPQTAAPTPAAPAPTATPPTPSTTPTPPPTAPPAAASPPVEPPASQ